MASLGDPTPLASLSAINAKNKTTYLQRNAIVHGSITAQPALAQISQTHPEDAQSISRFVEASAHEATCQAKRPEHLNTHLRGSK